MEGPVFVQFLHPGPEHKPIGNKISWNTGEHKRKFFKNPGTYLSNLTYEPINDSIIFWGEWEPESYVLKSFKQKKGERGWPRYLYQPYYCTKQNYGGLQNTDPFIFGKNFIYSNCRQEKIKKLRNLPKGSIILFGSCLGKHFVLDTVFVVNGKWIDVDSTKLADVIPRLSQTFIDVSIAPLYPDFFSNQFSNYQINSTNCTKHMQDYSKTKACSANNSECTFRIYFGANYEERHENGGIFSFFPCIPYTENTDGFQRPLINLDGSLINPKLNTSAKISSNKSFDEIKKIWEQVVDRVTNHYGLKLGVYTDLPKAK